MSIIESKLKEFGFQLPPPFPTPAGMHLPFDNIRIIGNRVLISGHAPQNPDGTLARPLGKVGAAVTEEEAYQAARLVALSMLGSLQRTLGNLDRIYAWTRLFGMVNSAPGFQRQPAVINGASDLILQLFGPVIGAHSRSAVGMAELPFNIPVEIEAEVELRPL